MASPLVIPAIFRAIDQITRPMAAMGKSIGSFTDKAISDSVRLKEKFKANADQALSVAGKAFAVSAATAAPLALAVNVAVNYQDAVASFRTIVSDLNDADFSPYKSKIEQVGDDTRQQYETVAKSFEIVAGLNQKFAATADGLGAISKESITLSKASRMELQPATEALVGIMNVYSAQALEAGRYSNALAAGQAVGASSIQSLALSYKNAGSTLSGANESIEGGVALLEVLGAKMIKDEEAGTKLRGSILKLQQANLGYRGGVFSVTDALEDARKKLSGLGTEQKKNAYLTKVFGIENINAGRILVEGVEQYKEFKNAVTGTSEAQKAAAINQATLKEKALQLKNTLVNLGVRIGEVLLPILEKITDRVIPIIENIGKWAKAHPKLTKALAAGTAIFSAAAFAIGVLAVAVWAVNTALYANPVVWVIGAIIGLVAVVALAIINFETWGKWILRMLGPIGWLIEIIVRATKDTAGWGEQFDATIKWMDAVFTMWTSTLYLQFQVLSMAFWSLVDTIVGAWYWAQNKLGYLSDEQYSKNMAQIEAEKVARVNAAMETADKINKAWDTVKKGPGWHVYDLNKLSDNALTDEQLQDRWQSRETPYPARVAPAMNPKAENNEATIQKILAITKGSQEIIVRAAPGTEAEKGKSTGNGTGVKIESTMTPR